MKGIKKKMEKAKNAVEKRLEIDLDGDGVVGKKKKDKKKKDKHTDKPKDAQNPYMTTNVSHPDYAQPYQPQHLHPQPQQVPNYQHPSQHMASAPPEDNFFDSPQDSQQLQPQTQLMKITVPQNTRPGQNIQVRSPTGEIFSIKLPSTAYPGSTLQVQLPVAPHVPITPVEPQQHMHNYPQSFPSWHNFNGYEQHSVGLGLHVPRIPPTQQHVQPSGRKKALLIGINYLGTKAELRGCVNDVSRMRDFLINQGFPDSPESMVVLVDEDMSGRHRDGKPNRKTILRAIQWLTANVSQGDVLFFHFSGHGAQELDNTGAEKDGYNETICPVDFQKKGMIADDVLWDSLVYPLPSGVKLTSVMDCCHSGTGLDLPYRFKYKHEAGKWKTEKNPSLCEGDVVLFSGCNDDETSLDSAAHVKDPYGGNSSKIATGAMTHAFLSAASELQLGRDRNISYYTFLKHVYRHLQPTGASYISPMHQNPQLTCSQIFDINQRKFSIDAIQPGEIVPNGNANVGRVVRHHYHPKTNFRGTGLDSMLMTGGAFVAGMVVADAVETIAEGVGGLLNEFF